MAVTLLQVLVLGAIAAAADDVPITWWSTPRVSLACVVPAAEKVQQRSPPPPLEGDDKPRPGPYLWWRGTEEIKQVPANGTIEVLKEKDGSTEGVYQCAARHLTGLVLGYPINLRFAYINEFSVHPANATARIGQPFVLSCDINSGPAATVSWLKDGVRLPDDSRYNLLNNQLLITDVRRDDIGLYRCKATNAQVNQTKISHGGRLAVEEDSGDLSPALLPLNVSSNVIASKGTSIVLPCPVTGSPRPTLIWMFTHAGERTAELEDVSELLTLRELDTNQEGIYNCSVEGNTNIIKSFNLTVVEPVMITIPPNSKQALGASTVRFNCTAVGNPVPTITWYKDGVPLQLTGRKTVLSSVDGSRLELLIRSVTLADGGVYQCFANNGMSSASAWAVLNVTGSGVAAPADVQCWPLGPKTIGLRWSKVSGVVMAYTVHITQPGDNPILPFINTEEKISVNEPLTPYGFQVRAYLRSETTLKNVATEISKIITCQGQGVPIRLTRLEDSVLVSWRQFAHQNPGVVQWILQYKYENSTEVHNVTINGEVLNYNLKEASHSGPMLIRVLGTKSLPWLHQNLTQVPWRSTAAAGSDLDDDGEVDIPKELQVVDVRSREFTIRWRYDEADPWHTYLYLVCTTKLDGIEECIESGMKLATVKDLQPDSNYMVRVKISGQVASSLPIHITTNPEGPRRFIDMTYKFINASTLRVSWNSKPAKYIVHYSDELVRPMNEWASLKTMGNTVLLTGLDLTKSLYVMVTGYEPEEHTSVLQIPFQVKEALKYTLTSTGVKISWRGLGARVVKYSQNLTLSMGKWSVVNVTTNTVHITGLNPTLPTYVVVSTPGHSQHSQVLTIPGRPAETSLLYLWVGVFCGVTVLCALTVAAICIWRKRKRTRSPDRTHRRRNVSPREGSEEEGAEMKSIGGRLANGGGSKEAGEPLLNGHVHITENPNQSKTPNGRMRRGQRYEVAFDVARYDDPDTTQETVLDADTSASTTYNLLDTSRRPEYDLSRSSRDISDNNSFNKLPDDNMNSELTRSIHFQLDNSKILPTLQPNG